MIPEAAEDRAMNRFLAGRTVVTALLLANLVGGTAAVIARANTPADPGIAEHTATTITTSTTATTTTATPTATALTTTAPALTTAAPGPADCGQGSAAARAVLTRIGDAYDLSARVGNETDRPIEIDSLVVRAVYPDGTRRMALPTAGLRIETGSGGVKASFPVPGGQSAARPSSFEIAEFRFHPAGQPECASH
jgi:hypothetical protein